MKRKMTWQEKEAKEEAVREIMKEAGMSDGEIERILDFTKGFSEMERAYAGQ